MAIRVHETAFMTAYFRSQHENLSKDPFSRHWLSIRTKTWVDEYVIATSTTEAIFHALRNRFFYEQMKAFSEKYETVQIINLGAGFSMYPYLLPDNIKHIELDQAHVVSYKNEKTKEFTEAGLLPPRNVHRLACDLRDLDRLFNILNELTSSKTKTLILIEGVFFYLEKPIVERIIQGCKACQTLGDLFCAVSFLEEFENTPTYKRFEAYFKKEGDFNNHKFTNLPSTFYKQQAGYELIKQSSVLQYGEERKVLETGLVESEVLNEYLYVLERK